MTFTTASEFPTHPESYFAHFHNRSREQKVFTTQDLKDIVEELRLAYVQYPEHRPRIEQMAHMLRMGVTKFASPLPTPSAFETAIATHLLTK